eukprot:COSAG03_NODE_16824_length_391_cov_1.167808_1_plen_34_part_01
MNAPLRLLLVAISLIVYGLPFTPEAAAAAAVVPP